MKDPEERDLGVWPLVLLLVAVMTWCVTTGYGGVVAPPMALTVLLIWELRRRR